MFCLCLIPGFTSAQAPGPAFPNPGADGAYAGDNYFQYINMPAHRSRQDRSAQGPYGAPAPYYGIETSYGAPGSSYKYTKVLD